MSVLPVTAPKPKPRGSTPLYIALADRIEARIANGELPEGSQLAPERELAKQNGVAYLTARQAVGILVKKGVVSRRHGYGTFVKEGGQKSLIALLCGPDLSKEPYQFYRAMVRAVEKEGHGSNMTFRVYDGLSDPLSPSGPGESQAQRTLHEDLSNYSFSGVIEIADGSERPWSNRKDFPPAGSVFEVGCASSDVELDWHHFGKAAIQHLTQRVVRKIQILRFPAEKEVSSSLLEGAFEGVAEAGIPELKVKVSDILIDRKEYERNIYNATRELIRGWLRVPADAPEGLIVSDDIAMRAVALALIQSNFGIEKHLPIVCQASEGIEYHYGLPVTRYEYQLGEAARTLIEILNLRIQNKPLPKLPVMIFGVLKPNAL